MRIHVGGGQERGEDETAEYGVAPPFAQVPGFQNAQPPQEKAEQRQLEDQPEGQQKLDGEGKVGPHWRRGFDLAFGKTHEEFKGHGKDHKIAGILIENNLLGKVIDSSIVGIGLNINQTSFPEFLVNPTSLSKITGEVHDVQYLLNRFMQEFESLYANIENDKQAIEERYMHKLYRLQGYHLYKDKDGEFEAKIIDVAPSGHLYLQAIYEDCQRVYAFKEVQFLNR